MNPPRGAVAVSMDIRMLDIDQCQDKYYVPNAFKETHKCDEISSYVSSTTLKLVIKVKLRTRSFTRG
jgi:hypothetical protein